MITISVRDYDERDLLYLSKGLTVTREKLRKDMHCINGTWCAKCPRFILCKDLYNAVEYIERKLEAYETLASQNEESNC